MTASERERETQRWRQSEGRAGGRRAAGSERDREVGTQRQERQTETEMERDPQAGRMEGGREGKRVCG